MNEERLDQMIRDHLDRQAEAIDPRPLFGRIQASLGHRPRLARARWAWPMAAAAAVMSAFLLWQGRSPAHASAENLVRAARAAHHLPLDRCYLVELRKESELIEEATPAVPPRVTHLWTRGDRFFVESAGPLMSHAWGRDDKGRVWMSFGPRRGARIEPDEVTRWLSIYCETLTLRPETLLGEVLAHFELTREPGDDGATLVVRATRKLPHPFASLRSAVLEIDSETKVIRRLIVERMRQGRLVATVTYTLAETRVIDADKYELEGHLVSPYEIYTRDHRPERRLAFVKRFFGPQASLWFGPESKQ